MHHSWFSSVGDSLGALDPHCGGDVNSHCWGLGRVAKGGAGTTDVKKLGRIPPGGGWRIHGRRRRPSLRRGLGYAFLHTALDDHSRLAYSVLLTDEGKDTAAAFWRRAHAYFTACGITVRRVLTDNGQLLPVLRRPRRPRRHRARPHPTLPAADDWQGRTLPPHTGRRVGLRRRLRQRCPARCRLPCLAPLLQPPPRPHRTRRPTSGQPHHQPVRAEQLIAVDPVPAGASR